MFQHFLRGLWVFEIQNERVEPLLVKAVDCRGEITETLHRDPGSRQNPAQDLGSGIVTGNQQCEKGHNYVPRRTTARLRPDYGHRGAVGRVALEPAAPPPDAPAFAAMLSEGEPSSTSIKTVLSSSSFSANKGATSRSFSAAC